MPIKVSLSLCQDLLVTVQLQKDLEKRKYQEWIEDVEKAYQWLKERTSKRFVTGLSMGGTLTLYMGEKHKDIAGLITINAAVQMPNETSMLILGSLGIPRFAKGVGSDIKKGIKEPAYELTPIRATKQLALLLRLVRNNIKRRRSTHTYLLFQGRSCGTAREPKMDLRKRKLNRPKNL